MKLYNSYRKRSCFIMIAKANQVLRKPFTSPLFSYLLEGVAVGVITGTIVGVFRLIIDHTMQILFTIYPIMAKHPIYLLPYILLMVLVCIVLGKIIKPYLSDLVGSGVPQIEAIFLNENKMSWWSVLWRKFIGGLLAICPGLMLGREGPCIEMGAMVGQGLGESVFHSDDRHMQLLQQSGVAAGLSAAFSAPLAGVFFLVEEITFRFKPRECLMALAASFSADLMTLFFFGTTPCLYLPVKANLPLKVYWILPILGIILGLLAYVYQYCLLSLKPIFSKVKKIPSQYHSIIPFILIIPVGLWNAKMLGGSHDLIGNLFTFSFKNNLNNQTPLMMILIPLMLFAIRFIYSMLSYGSSVPGGIFMPILVLGAMLGVAFAILLIHNGIVDPKFYPNIVVIAMAAYFGAIEKAPFTAVTLLSEMVGTIEQILPMIITALIAYFVLDLIGGKPIYEALRIQMNYKKLQ